MFGMSSSTTIGVVLLLLGSIFIIIAIIVSVQGIWTIRIDPRAQKPSSILGGVLLVLGLIFALIDPVRGFAISNLPPTATPTTVTPTLMPTSTPTPTPTPSPLSVLIISPTDGSKVLITTQVQGTAFNIPPGKELWLLVQSSGTSGYFPEGDAKDPKSISIFPDGKWTVNNVYIGDATDRPGMEYVLNVALVDQNSAGRAAIVQYFVSGRTSGYKPLDSLPEGIQLITHVQVVRG